ncbi:hypothetical protein BHM03_00024390 [Ensete ventricosum]|nr:hypothetical protein BHM03_00024390 [Ensete ventricosum]
MISKLPTLSIPSQNLDTRRITREELKQRSAKDHSGSSPRVAGCSATPARGDSRPQPRRRGCCQRSVDDHPRPARKGRPTAGSAPTGRQPTNRGTTRKGYRLQGQRMQGRIPWRCRPQGWPPLIRAVAGGQGQPPPAQGQRRRRRGEEVLGHPLEKRLILPL